MESFFDKDAEVGSDEEEELEDENGDPVVNSSKARANGHMDDSSEEEDDDDEEAQRAVNEGFIADEDEDEVDGESRKRERKKKRRRGDKDVDDMLDEEDLDLIGETHPDYDRRQAEQSKFKRLKRGHREDHTANEARGVEDIFSDEEDGADGAAVAPRRSAFGFGDDMDDFIEQDEFPDEEGAQLDEELGVRAPRRPGIADLQNLKDSGLDEADLEDMRGAFGDGGDFEWALEVEKRSKEDQLDPDKPLELKDVFEPSQLVEKMLTDEDNHIRMTDIPERLQLARKPYKDLADLSEQELQEREREEPAWISGFMFPKKRMEARFRKPFEDAVKHVLQFMNVENYEPAFIFQNRKDYLIHSEQIPLPPDPRNPEAPAFKIRAEKLLNQTDLWEIFEFDLKYRAFAEKRESIRKSVDTLKEMLPDFKDATFEELIPTAATLDDLQDLQDYLNFQYSAQLKDASLAEAEINGTQKRARGTRNIWDKVRSGSPYHLVRAFGISAEGLAQNADKTGRAYVEDPDKRPDDLADELIQAPEFKTGEDVLTAAKAMFVEEVIMNPRMKRFMRKTFFEQAVFDVHRTEKGLKAIDEEHPYYEFKYLCNQGLRELVSRPDLFLRMLKAESEGLVEVRTHLRGEKRIREDLQRSILSDSFSEIADAWNALRREAIETAMDRLSRLMAKGVRDNVKNECENSIARECREAYMNKLDQAPFKPNGMLLGTLPRVLALSNGAGNRGDAICWAYLEENGRVQENGKFTDLRMGNAEKFVSEGKDLSAFVELVERRKPDIVAVSGWSVETRKLYKELQDIIENHDLRGTPYEDDNEREQQDPLEVVIANDEVARLFQTSDRAATEHPGVPPLTRYAIALAKYLQNPMKEYAALGKNITSIAFEPNQHLITEEKLRRSLETAMVDMVNLVGVDVNEALNDGYVANLLPYVAGLGPRKAAHMLKVLNQNGGEVMNRQADLFGDADRARRPAVTPKVWQNCASFVYVVFEDSPESDYLDNTRIHPEDYDVARKIAADALDLDEEDIKAEIDEGGPSAVVRKLIKDDQQDKVNDLELEQYADQLEKMMMQRKRATLETVRAELQNPFEELRRQFNFMTSSDMFTMMTGETENSLQEGMIVPVSVKKAFSDHIEVKLDCGIEGGISAGEFPDDVVKNQLEARQVFVVHQTIQAKLQFLDRKKLTAQLSLRDTQLREPFRRQFDHELDEWDAEQEERDRKEAKKASNDEAGRAQRVIKHPLFRPFNTVQAIDFLASQGRGDCVIRPSSKGPDHLAVTWKVHEDVYAHIDVLELDKENEFSVGRTLKIGRSSYSDLDELIVLHVKAMAKKVEEMMGDEKYQSGSREQTGKSRHGRFSFFSRTNSLTRSEHRAMVDDLHRSQPQTFHVRLLPQLQISGLLLSVFQERPERASCQLAGQSHPQRVRAQGPQVSGHARVEKRLQDALLAPGTWGSGYRDKEMKRGEISECILSRSRRCFLLGSRRLYQ